MTPLAVAPRPPRFSIVIPAQDADATIGACLERYADAFADSEIIVVLDGQADPASDTVERIIASKGNVVGIRIPGGVAKGGAVRTGFLVAHADVVGYVDAAGSTSPAEMRRLCESIGDEDGVIGSRWLRASRVSGSRPLRLKVASRSYNALVSMLFGLRYSEDLPIRLATYNSVWEPLGVTCCDVSRANELVAAGDAPPRFPLQAVSTTAAKIPIADT